MYLRANMQLCLLLVWHHVAVPSTGMAACSSASKFGSCALLYSVSVCVMCMCLYGNKQLCHELPTYHALSYSLSALVSCVYLYRRQVSVQPVLGVTNMCIAVDFNIFSPTELSDTVCFCRRACFRCDRHVFLPFHCREYCTGLQSARKVHVQGRFGAESQAASIRRHISQHAQCTQNCCHRKIWLLEAGAVLMHLCQTKCFDMFMHMFDPIVL